MFGLDRYARIANQAGIKTMRLHTLFILLLCISVTSPSFAEETVQKVVVADPFLEMHTGPANSFPIFYVVKRNESIKVIKRHTSWFLIQNDKDKEGWVHSSQLTKTLTLEGDEVEIKEFTYENYLDHDGEMGMIGGTFGDDAMMSIFASYSLTRNMSVEGTISQILGNFSSSMLLTVELMNQPYPEWKFSPYFSIGTGIITTKVTSTLSKLKDNQDFTANVGFGIKMYITRRFILKADIRKHFRFQSLNENEETTAWQGGFAFFF